MKKSLVITAGVLAGLTFGSYANSCINTQPVFAKTTKKSTTKIVAKVGSKKSMTLTVNSKDIRVQKMTEPDGKEVQVLLVKGTFKNTGKETEIPNVDFEAKQETGKGVWAHANSYTPYDKQLSDQDAELNKHLNDELDPNASVDALLIYKLDGTGKVRIKSIFDGKGTLTINVNKLINNKQSQSSQSH